MTSGFATRRTPYPVAWVATIAAVTCQVKARIDNAAAMPNQERGAAVSVCSALRPWSAMWGEFRHLD